MVRIIIVDDQKLVREGVKILLEKKTEIAIVGEASSGTEALQKIETLKPDVVLLDISMPGINGLTVAEKIRSKFPGVKIIMLSSYEDDSYVRKATELGAKGYLLKSASSQELDWSIKLVHQGYSAIKSELLEKQFVSDSEVKSNLRTNLVTDKKPNEPPIAVVNKQERSNFNEVKLVPKPKKAKKNYPPFQKPPKKRRSFINGASIHQIKKTLKSFEFRLLIFAILFSLGFLVFIALS